MFLVLWDIRLHCRTCGILRVQHRRVTLWELALREHGLQRRGPFDLIAAWGRGDRQSLDELMGLVYHELHGMASGILSGEPAGSRRGTGRGRPRW
jgi:hypothetical protein